jgi:molybdate/tungstate transport system substrate-binding protein
VFNAGSLARPLRAALDTFAAIEGITVDQEHAGSLETARKLTELGRVPDLIALADHEVFPLILMPDHSQWYLQFARNRMVLAYTDRSRHADRIATDNWWRLVTEPGVEVGRADPNLDPNGYRSLLVMQLAERYYSAPGLAQRLLAASPVRNVRPNEAALVALLEAGEFDYIWSYESIARGAGLRHVRLPVEIDLSDPGHSSAYASASLAVRGRTPRDTMVVQGAPIVYGLSIPIRAPHPRLGERFAAYLLSEHGRRVLAANHLDVLERPIVVGTGVPEGLARLLALPASGTLPHLRAGPGRL